MAEFHGSFLLLGIGQSWDLAYFVDVRTHVIAYEDIWLEYTEE